MDEKKVSQKKSTSQAVKKIMIVDDHPLVREGLSFLIESIPRVKVTAEVGSVEEARYVLQGRCFDLLLLDLSLPGCSGLQFIKEALEMCPLLRVLVLSMHEEGIYAERVLRAGAHGYMMKHSSSADIIYAIQLVLRGEMYVSAAVASSLAKQLVDRNKGKEPCDISQLSDRELQVYTYLGEGLSSREISERLSLSCKTVHAHRENIKRKLCFRNATELVYHAMNWVQANVK